MIMAENFYRLSLEKKRERLKALLEQMKDADEIFRRFLNIVNDDKVQEATLDVLYNDIMMFAESVNEYKRTKSVSALNKAQSYLQNLYQLEQESRKQDEKDLAKIEDMFQTI